VAVSVPIYRLLNQKIRIASPGNHSGVMRFLRKSYGWILGGMECEGRYAKVSVWVVIMGDIVHACLVSRITPDSGIKSGIIGGAEIHGLGVVVEVMPIGALEELIEGAIGADQCQSGKDDLVHVGAG